MFSDSTVRHPASVEGTWEGERPGGDGPERESRKVRRLPPRSCRVRTGGLQGSGGEEGGGEVRDFLSTLRIPAGDLAILPVERVDKYAFLQIVSYKYIRFAKRLS